MRRLEELLLRTGNRTHGLRADVHANQLFIIETLQWKLREPGKLAFCSKPRGGSPIRLGRVSAPEPIGARQQWGKPDRVSPTPGIAKKR